MILSVNCLPCKHKKFLPPESMLKSQAQWLMTIVTPELWAPWHEHSTYTSISNTIIKEIHFKIKKEITKLHSLKLKLICVNCYTWYTHTSIYLSIDLSIIYFSNTR